tara:strand:+ start:62 stop:547 length:486 start_codon:yes stop_codon:yes gene_type:complete
LESYKNIKRIASYNSASGSFVRTEKCRGCLPGDKMGSIDNDGYERIVIEGRNYYSHRLAWFYIHGEFTGFIDHINGIKNDNRICNLRVVTGGENAKNRPKGKNNKSGHVGISWFIPTKKWRATVNHNKKQIHIGYYDALCDAVDARQIHSDKYNYHENHGR